MCKIIIAEDEYLEREYFKSIIRSIDNAVIVGEVNSGLKAIEFCGALKPELIFLNVRMGGLSGIDAAIRIKKENRDIAVILTSGYDEGRIRTFIKGTNVDGYLLKPIKSEKIVEIVKKYDAGQSNTNPIVSTRVSKKDIKYYPRHIMTAAVNNALTYIDDNFRNDLSLDQVAEAVFLSSYYLSRLFKKEVGVTFSSYVIHKKIEDAKVMLESTNKSILEISTYLSFKEQNYFCKVFKKHTGLTPTEYRAAINQKARERKRLINNYLS